MLIKVRDKKTGNIRTVTQKAYAALGPKVYEKLGTVNDDGTEIGSPNQSTPQVSRSVRGAAPVVVKQQLVAPKQEEPAAEEPVQEEQPEPVKVKGKPGPKSKKSISSNSDKNEE